MNETDFNDLIDGKFPYHDRPLAVALIEQANIVSTNAMFITLEEICRPPKSVKVKAETLLELIDAWSARMDHPLSKPISSVARTMVSGSRITVPRAAALMEEIAEFKGQYAALNIVYFSSDDADDLLEARDRAIRLKWSMQ